MVKIRDDGTSLAPEAVVSRVTVFRETVSGSDISGFAGITGDCDPVHVDHEESVRLGLPGRITDGSLTLGDLSAALSIVMQAFGVVVVSAHYVEELRRQLANIRVTNGRDELVKIATHIHTVLRRRISPQEAECRRVRAT